MAAWLLGAVYVARAANWDVLRFAPDWPYRMGIRALVAPMALVALMALRGLTRCGVISPDARVSAASHKSAVRQPAASGG